MKLEKPFSRLLVGALSLLVLAAAGFLWAGAAIPSWNAAPEDVSRELPGDGLVAKPEIIWNHAITIHAPPEEVYPWLVQIGDTRAGFYSFTFIENLFQIAGNQTYRYANAGRIHPEWQNPPAGQGIISNWMAIQAYQPGQYVLASATSEFFGLQWSWLWYLQPADGGSTRLIVRHRMAFPQGMPKDLMAAVINAGYIMERGMLLGIRDRAEGMIPPAFSEPAQILLWLAALACGLIAAVGFVRKPGRAWLLGVGSAAVVILFAFTFIQPALWLRAALDLVLIAGLAAALASIKVGRKSKKAAAEAE